MSPAGAMSLLVIGASGLVGGELARQARRAGIGIHGAARTGRGEATFALDLADRAQIDRALGELNPQAIALCSAWPHVDGCEKDPDRSRRENVATIANVLAAVGNSRTRLIFFSTDQVFDGSKPTYVESDRVSPLNVYARHKREVEEMLLTRGDCLIVRTAWVFGEELLRKNFVYQVIRSAQEGRPLKVPRDQSGCPTHSSWLARSTLQLLGQGFEGLAHLSGGELLTKAAWARMVSRGLGLSSRPGFEVSEVPWPEAGQVAPRPRQVALRSERHRLVHPPLSEVLQAERERLLSKA